MPKNPFRKMRIFVIPMLRLSGIVVIALGYLIASPQNSSAQPSFTVDNVLQAVV